MSRCFYSRGFSNKNINKKQIKQAIQKLDVDINRYLDEMDESDEEVPESVLQWIERGDSVQMTLKEDG